MSDRTIKCLRKRLAESSFVVDNTFFHAKGSAFAILSKLINLSCVSISLGIMLELRSISDILSGQNLSAFASRSFKSLIYN
jgi:hypothetical protein